MGQPAPSWQGSQVSARQPAHSWQGSQVSARSQQLQAASCEKDNLALLLRQSVELLAASEMSFVL